MNGNSILLDTNIVLYLLSGDTALANLLFDKKLYVSFVTQLELLGYPDISEKEKQGIRTFLDDCVIIDINSQIKEGVIRIKQTKRIRLPDSIIMATSKYLGVPVISSDNDFRKVEDIDVILYEKE